MNGFLCMCTYTTNRTFQQNTQKNNYDFGDFQVAASGLDYVSSWVSAGKQAAGQTVLAALEQILRYLIS